MKQVRVHINGYISVPDEATDKQIEEAVEFAVGINGNMSKDNPVDYDLEWESGWVQIGI